MMRSRHQQKPLIALILVFVLPSSLGSVIDNRASTELPSPSCMLSGDASADSSTTPLSYPCPVPQGWDVDWSVVNSTALMSTNPIVSTCILFLQGRSKRWPDRPFWRVKERVHVVLGHRLECIRDCFILYLGVMLHAALHCWASALEKAVCTPTLGIMLTRGAHYCWIMLTRGTLLLDYADTWRTAVGLCRHVARNSIHFNTNSNPSHRAFTPSTTPGAG